MISGLSNGFHLGFNPLAVSFKSARQNMPSASLHPSLIDQYLLTEPEKGTVAGPFSIAPIPNIHISRFRIIPKKYQPGKWRLLLDLSIHVQYSDIMRFLVRHNRHHKVSQSVPLFKSRKTVTIFFRIKVGGHFVMSIVTCHESHYAGVLDNPRLI